MSVIYVHIWSIQEARLQEGMYIMKKRVLSVLLVAAMLSTLLAGCEKKPEAATDSTAAADGDVVKIGVFEPA